MPQVIPFIAAAAFPGFATVAYVATQLAVAAYQADRAARKDYAARLAAENADRQRGITFRSAVAPRRLVLGTAKLSGPLAYAEFVGTDEEFLDLIIACSGNELSAVQGVFVGEEYIPVAAITAQVPTSGRYAPSANGNTTEVLSATAGVITTTKAPLSAADVAVTSQTDWSGPLGVASVVGTTVTLSSAFTGSVTVSYTHLGDPPLKLQWMLGSPTQASTTWSGVSTPKWTATDRLQGIGHVRALLRIDHPVYQTGTPDIALLATGPVGVYDPRTDTTVAGTSNPALLAAWFRTLPRKDGGMGIPTDWIDWPSVAAAANVCDETIAVHQLDGTGDETIKRYECHTVLTLDRAPIDNLRVILSAMAGDFPFTAGKYRCFAGAFRAATVTITDDDVDAASPITFAPASGAMAMPPNVVTGTIFDAANNYTEMAAPQVENAGYIAADGSEEALELRLSASTDARQANYLMGVELERSRPALAGQVTVKGKGCNLAVMDTLQFSLAGYAAVASRTFEVRRIRNDWSNRYTLDVVEVNAAMWTLDPDTFTPQEPGTPPDTSHLWDVQRLVSLTATSGTAHLQTMGDGTITARALLSWPLHGQQYVRERGRIELRWRTAAAATWVDGAPVAGNQTSAYIGPLVDGTAYLVEARAVNGLSVPGPWLRLFHVAEGKTAAPAAPTGLAATVRPGSVEVAVNPNTEADYSETEFRIGASWAAGTRIYRGSAFSFLWPWPAQATYTLRARHYDTSGNESAEATLGVTVGSGVLVNTPNVADDSVTRIFSGEDSSTAGGGGTTATMPAFDVVAAALSGKPVQLTGYARVEMTIETTGAAVKAAECEVTVYRGATALSTQAAIVNLTGEFGQRASVVIPLALKDTPSAATHTYKVGLTAAWFDASGAAYSVSVYGVACTASLTLLENMTST